MSRLHQNEYGSPKARLECLSALNLTVEKEVKLCSTLRKSRNPEAAGQHSVKRGRAPQTSLNTGRDENTSRHFGT